MSVCFIDSQLNWICRRLFQSGVDALGDMKPAGTNILSAAGFLL